MALTGTVMRTPDPADLRLADAFVVADPYPYYDALRAAGRVRWHDTLFGGAWLVMGFDRVKELLRDSDRLSSARYRAIVDQLDERDAAGAADLLNLHSKWMIFFDPPKHTRLRRIMARGFSKGVLASLRDVVDSGVRQYADRLADRETIDVVGDFAQRIPVLAIAALLGVSPNDRELFVRWTHDIAAYMGSERPDLRLIRNAQASMIEFQEYFDEIARERKRAPRADDLISLLVVAPPGEELLTEEELFAQATLLLFAGFETTKNLIASSVLCLLKNTGQARLLRQAPQLAGEAIEEVLRCESPVQFARRIAARDFSYEGCQIRRGDVVSLLIGAANRDPERFDLPHEFLVERQPKGYLSFGGGRHLCLGQHLARLEAGLAINALLERAPSLLHEPSISFQWQINPGFRGLARLEVSR